MKKIAFAGTDGRTLLSALVTATAKSDHYQEAFEGIVIRGTPSMPVFCELMNWPVGFIETASNSVSDYTAAIIAASREVETFDAVTSIELADVGICTLPEVAAVAAGPELMVNQVEEVIASELNAGRTPIMLGGEHSLTTGAVRAYHKKFPDLSVLHNLLVYARYFNIKKKLARKRAEELLTFFQLQEKRNKKINTLSGGMRRRLLLARGFINNPEIVILDEPTVGLDPQARHIV